MQKIIVQEGENFQERLIQNINDHLLKFNENLDTIGENAEALEIFSTTFAKVSCISFCYMIVIKPCSFLERSHKQMPKKNQHMSSTF